MDQFKAMTSTGLPESHNPYMRKADRLQANGRYSEAIDSYIEVIRSDMNLRFEACVAITYCLMSLGRYGDASTVCGYAENEYDGIERQGTLWTHSYLLHLKLSLRKRLGGGSQGSFAEDRKAINENTKYERQTEAFRSWLAGYNQGSTSRFNPNNR